MTNLKVDGSTIGILNTGSLVNYHNLNVRVGKIKQANSELADMLLRLANSFKDLPQDQHRNAIEHLDFITEQLASPEDGRKVSVMAAMVKNFPTILGTSDASMSIWERLYPLLVAAIPAISTYL